MVCEYLELFWCLGKALDTPSLRPVGGLKHAFNPFDVDSVT